MLFGRGGAECHLDQFAAYPLRDRDGALFDPAAGRGFFFNESGKRFARELLDRRPRRGLGSGLRGSFRSDPNAFLQSARADSTA